MQLFASSGNSSVEVLTLPMLAMEAHKLCSMHCPRWRAAHGLICTFLMFDVYIDVHCHSCILGAYPVKVKICDQYEVKLLRRLLYSCVVDCYASGNAHSSGGLEL